MMMFAILFGLSMDYEVFLLSRIREEYVRHGDTRRAVADGLAKTARVITAAAAIMVVVFLAFVRRDRGLPEDDRHRPGDGDLRRRDDRADGAGAGRDGAARQAQLVDPGLARAHPAAPGRRAGRGGRGGAAVAGTPPPPPAAAVPYGRRDRRATTQEPVCGVP